MWHFWAWNSDWFASGIRLRYAKTTQHSHNKEKREGKITVNRVFIIWCLGIDMGTINKYASWMEAGQNKEFWAHSTNGWCVSFFPSDSDVNFSFFSRHFCRVTSRIKSLSTSRTNSSAIVPLFFVKECPGNKTGSQKSFLSITTLLFWDSHQTFRNQAVPCLLLMWRIQQKKGFCPKIVLKVECKPGLRRAKFHLF